MGGEHRPDGPLALPPRRAVENATRAELNSGHFNRSDGYLAYRSRGTPTGLLFFTHAGHGFFRSSAGGVHVTGPGELVYYEPNVEQDYGTVPRSVWDFHYAHFHPRPHWASWLGFPLVPGVKGLRRLVVGPGPIRQELRRLWEQLDHQVKLGTRWQREFAMNTLEQILLLVCERVGTGASRPLDARVQTALEIMAREPARPHPVAALARAAGLSPSRFAHLFRSEMGLSVTEVLIRNRLKQAEVLLEMTPMRISEVAYATGFAGPSHFAAQFTKRYGMSPRAFRARSRA